MDERPEEAWSKGMAAGLGGQALASNPYPAGSELFLDWEGGWREGAHVSHIPTPEEETQAWFTWMPQRSDHSLRG